VSKTIGLVFIDGWADWEFGYLSGSAADWFDTKVVALSPGARQVRSIGGLLLIPDRSTDASANGDLDAVVAVGSDDWSSASPPEIGHLLRSVADRAGVVAGICAGTLALARAGMFEGVAHTSNGREWISEILPGYSGAAMYRDVPHAVSDRRIVSAPGTAPGTFAAAVLEALYPEKADLIVQAKALFAKEYAEAS
jgi:putative intracellular protease/amidase